MAIKNNKSKNKKKNVVTCLIPGLNKLTDIPFPVGKLPVCTKCKKIYKTRSLCRVRDGHTDLPWNTSYICFLLDDSCFTVDDQGKQCLVKEYGPNAHKFIAKNTECSPVKYLADFTRVGTNANPICTPCKVKNYAKSHCRGKHDHKHLPWGTIYISLTAEKIETYEPPIKKEADDEITNSTEFVVEKATSGMKRSLDYIFDASMESSVSKKFKCDDNELNVISSEVIDSKYSIGANSSYIADVSASKAFLLVLHNNQSTLQWLTIDDDSTNLESMICSEVTKNTGLDVCKENMFGHGHNVDELCHTTSVNYRPTSPLLEMQNGYHTHELNNKYSESHYFDWSRPSHTEPKPMSPANVSHYSQSFNGYQPHEHQYTQHQHYPLHAAPSPPYYEPSQSMMYRSSEHDYCNYGTPREMPQQDRFDHYSEAPHHNLSHNHYNHHGYSRSGQQDTHSYHSYDY